MLGETQTDLSSALRDYLERNHYTVQTETHGLRILECLKAQAFDIILLDLALPGLDGIGIVKGYRANKGSAPVILMTGRHCSEELQIGLNSGADAYLVKPFRLDDLGVQMKALLRRPELRHEASLISGDLEMNTSACTVKKKNSIIHLHPMEYKLLQFMMKHPNQVFTTHAIFERVWQKDSGQLEDTVRTHIRTLRQKVDSAGQQSIITTVRGQGYKTENRI